MNTSTQPDVIEETITASETLMHASLGTLENSVRPKGLILTKDQIIDLHRYEKKALNLPTEISKVIAYLGYSSETLAGPGLAPADFARCFTVVRNHALRWNPLQQRVKNVSGELKVFAAQMLTYGDSIQSVISDIKSAQTLRQLGIKTLEDLKRVQIEMGDAFPGIEFDADDADAAIDFGHLLDRIIAKVADHEARTKQLKDDLASYGDDLSNEVRPAIALQLVAIENSPLKANIVRLQKVIDDLNKEIDEKSAAYKKILPRFMDFMRGALETYVRHNKPGQNEGDANTAAVNKEINQMGQQQQTLIQTTEQLSEGFNRLVNAQSVALTEFRTLQSTVSSADFQLMVELAIPSLNEAEQTARQ